jgi:putative aminopeptidase FrvX
LKYFHENDIQFENTEVWVFISGSEEAGLRGAKEFVKKHKAELSEIETFFLALETLRDFLSIAIFSRDLNNFVQHSPKVCQVIQKTALTCGVNVNLTAIPIGSTDAAAFSQAGFQATCVIACDFLHSFYYHSCYDTPENLDRNTLEAVTLLGIETAIAFYQNGFN